jgi:hypothetical protein
MYIQKKLVMFGILISTALMLSGAVYSRSYYDADRDYGRSEAKHACKDEVREKIWGDHRYIRKVEFIRGTFDYWRKSYVQTEVRGKGRYQNRKGRWRNFDFTCLYNPDRERVISASYRKNANDWDDFGSNDSDGRHACGQEIDRKILRKHESAYRIRWNDRSVRRNYKSGNKIAYGGSGEFIGGRGNRRYFDFSCTYDQRRDDVVDAWVDVRR